MEQIRAGQVITNETFEESEKLPTRYSRAPYDIFPTLHIYRFPTQTITLTTPLRPSSSRPPSPCLHASSTLPCARMPVYNALELSATVSARLLHSLSVFESATALVCCAHVPLLSRRRLRDEAHLPPPRLTCIHKLPPCCGVGREVCVFGVEGRKTDFSCVLCGDICS